MPLKPVTIFCSQSQFVTVYLSVAKMNKVCSDYSYMQSYKYLIIRHLLGVSIYLNSKILLLCIRLTKIESLNNKKLTAYKLYKSHIFIRNFTQL